MKKLACFLIAVLLTLSAVAQEGPSRNEIGLNIVGLKNVSVFYKTGNQSTLWRFTTLIGNAQTTTDHRADSLTTVTTDLGISLAGGREFIVDINDEFEFRYGTEIKVSYSWDFRENQDNIQNSAIESYNRYINGAGIYFIAGVNLVLKKKIVLGAELRPGINYSTTRTVFNSETGVSTTQARHIGFGLDNHGIIFSIAYMF